MIKNYNDPVSQLFRDAENRFARRAGAGRSAMRARASRYRAEGVPAETASLFSCRKIKRDFCPALWYSFEKRGKGPEVNCMDILVIDAQGGGVGRQLVAAIKRAFPEERVTAVGTNSIAASNMLKAGADFVATGENAVVVNCGRADVIVAPIGAVIADAMLGEITPAMALAAGRSPAKRILLPIAHCDNMVVGVKELGMGQLVQEAVERLRKVKEGCKQ